MMADGWLGKPLPDAEPAPPATVQYRAPEPQTGPPPGKPRFYEHLSAVLPDLAFLCDRCRVNLVFKPPFGIPTCYKCGEEQVPGHAFIRVGALESLLTTAALAQVYESVCARAKAMGQSFQPFQPGPAGLTEEQVQLQPPGGGE